MTALMRDVDDATAAELDQIGAVAVTPEVTTTNGAAELTEPSVAAHAESAPEPSGPVITVTKGAPTDDELAAVIAVLTAAAASGEIAAAPAAPEETWGHPTLLHRETYALSPLSFAVSPQLRP